jgi:hypothetical protein
MAKANETKVAKFLEVKVPRAHTIVVTFGNGASREIDIRNMPETVTYRATMLGFSNKLRDTGANFSKTKDFAGAIAQLDATIEALRADEWERNGGGAGINVRDLIRALAEIRNADEDKVAAAVEKMDDEQRKKIKANAVVAAKIAGYVEERAKAKAAQTSEEALDELPNFDDEENEEIIINLRDGE